MPFSARNAFILAAATILFAGAAFAEDAKTIAGAAPPNSQPNPYRTVTDFLKLPEGRIMGSSSGVAVDHEGNIWVADRCGANSCANLSMDPIMEFDHDGNFLKSFGGGKFLFPHGLYIDAKDHIWVTDGQTDGSKGFQVFEFDRNGKVLMTLGKAGVTGDGPDTFNQPNAVVVARNGDIFVSDGHTIGSGNDRVVKFTKNGKFIKQWGSRGSGPGQFEEPHAMAFDSRGRLFVGDRGNNRIEIFDQNGKLLDIWAQFSRPSGVYIDSKDTLYVADSESRSALDYGTHPGWQRGIRVGSARTGAVTAFIPDSEPNPESLRTSGAEGVWADTAGTIYGAEVGPKDIRKYVKQ